MNKKIIALLSTVLSGALIVGGVFAVSTAWAVTDNATPISGKITGGELDKDQTTYETLTWGSGTQLSNIEGMVDGGVYKVGVVKLKTESATYSRGTLEVSLVKETVATNLQNYVKVDIYEGDVGTATALPATGAPLVTLQPQYKNTGTKVYSIAPGVTGKADGKAYSIFVTLDCDNNQTTYAQVKDDIVYVRADWKAHEDDVTTTSRVYFAKPSGWGNNIKYYAYYTEDNKTVDNHDWPGLDAVVESVRGTGSGTQYYYVDLANNFTTVVFNDGNGNQTGNISFVAANYDASTPEVYDDNGTYKWRALPDLTTETKYELVGLFNGGQTDKWSYDSTATDRIFSTTSVEGEYKIAGISLTKDDQLKVLDSLGNWYPMGGDNYVVNETASYDIYFRPAGNSAWGYYYFELVKVSS